MSHSTLFSLATNFDDSLIDKIDPCSVEEVYGRVENDGMGGGRPRFTVPGVSWSRLKEHISRARRRGISFNYLLNDASSGTSDWASPKGYKRLRVFLDKLVDAGVHSITLVSPHLLRVVVRHTPLKVRVSVFARVDDVRKAGMWMEEGASVVMLDSMLVNRDPERLERIADAVGGEHCELLANNRCEMDCPWSPCHMVDLGKSSRRKIPVPDACYFHCQASFFQDPVRLLIQDWIRPEDISLYKRLGFRRFKLAGRGCSTEELVVRARAYAEERYEGNLMDLLSRGELRLNWFTKLSAFFTYGFHSVSGLLKLARVASSLEGAVVIDNRALDGYVDKIFQKGGCVPGRCFRCKMCRSFAARAVRVDPAVRDALEEIDRNLASGDIWQPSL